MTMTLLRQHKNRIGLGNDAAARRSPLVADMDWPFANQASQTSTDDADVPGRRTIRAAPENTPHVASTRFERVRAETAASVMARGSRGRPRKSQ